MRSAIYMKSIVFGATGGRIAVTFNFQMKPYFPKEVPKEFLLVDLVNNVNKLAEDQDVVFERISQVAASMDASALKKEVRRYGGVRAGKLFASFDDKGVS